MVRRLPRKQRADVALELQSLLHEELQSRADARGAALDADIALEGLRAFGRPDDAAVRYIDPWIIIPQTETRSFAFAAIVGASLLIALGPFEGAATRPSQVGIAILAWLGALVVFFGTRSLHRRRRGADDAWAPRDRDRANRVGSSLLVVVIVLGIVAYGAPGWIDERLANGRPLLAWLDFDPDFRAGRLPVLLALWGCQAVLFSILAVRGRWNPPLRRADFGLEITVVLTLVWFLAAGRIFTATPADTAARTMVGVFVLLMLVDLGVKRYRSSSHSGNAGRPGFGTNRAR